LAHETESLCVEFSGENDDLNSDGEPETVVGNKILKRRFQKSSFSSSPYMNVKVGKKLVSAFIDTGATFSSITPKYLDSLPVKYVHRRKNLGKHKFNVTLAVGEEKFVIEEEIELRFKVDNNSMLWKFYVVPGGTNELVFGMDWISKYHVVIDGKDKSVSIKRDLNREAKKVREPKLEYFKPQEYDVVGMYESEDEEKESTVGAMMRLSQSVEIPPLSCAKIKLKCNERITGDVEITGLKSITRKHGISLGTSIVSVIDGQGETFVLNPHRHHVKVNRGELCGTMEVIDHKNIVCELSDEMLGDENACGINVSKVKHASKMYNCQKMTIDPDIATIRLGDHLNESQKCKLLELLSKYRSCFAFNVKEIGCHPTAECVLDTGSSKPVNAYPYRVSYAERQEVNRQVQDYLDRGIIVESVSPYSSPVVLHRKPDGTHRFCCDYRRLNAVTQVDIYPLPRMDDIFDRVTGAKFISTLDCLQGYHQIKMAKDSQPKTAFVTSDGKYEWTRMPFGLASAPSCFQRVMDDVLKNLKWTIALVYLDDIVVYGKTFFEHNERLEKVLRALSLAKITLKPEKCRFAEKKIKVLGHIISEEVIAVNPEKKFAVEKFPTPKNKRDVRAFVALCNFYRRFVKDMWVIAKPLYELTEKNKNFVWDENCESAFCKLKEILCSDTVLAHPQEDGLYEIHTDASTQGLGAILLQQQGPNRKDLRTIGYASRTLNSAEKNYHVTELECLAIIYGIEKFRPYVYGKRFRVMTDHCSLCRLINLKNPNGRLARWALKLMPYDFEICYIKGSRHGHVDSLSRNPVGSAPDSEISFPDEYFFGYSNVVAKKLLCGVNQDYVIASSICHSTESVLAQQRKDKKLLVIINDILKVQDGVEPTIKNLEDYRLQDGILYKANWEPTGRLWRLCIPVTMRTSVMKEVHDSEAGGHLGLAKTWYTIKSRYWWSGMYRSVRRYCESCKICQLYNRRNFRSPGPLCPIEPPEEPFFRVGMDYIGPFPCEKSKSKYILVIVCHATRYVEAHITADQNTEEVIRIFKNCIIYRHGCPKEIIVDKGTPFQSGRFKDFCEKFDIRVYSCSSGHPQTNAIVEKHNDTIKCVMAKFVGDDHNSWQDRLDATVFSINTTVHTVTKYSPFFLLFGREPFLPCDARFPTLVEGLDDSREAHLEAHGSALKAAKRNTMRDQNVRKEKYDEIHKEVVHNSGDLVLHRNHQRYVGKVSKFNPKWKGPFIVLEKLSPVNYMLMSIPNSKGKSKKFVANVIELKSFVENYESDYTTVYTSTDSDDEFLLTEDITSVCGRNSSERIPNSSITLSNGTIRNERGVSMISGASRRSSRTRRANPKYYSDQYVN